jgi:chromosome segregation ATPase
MSLAINSSACVVNDSVGYADNLRGIIAVVRAMRESNYTDKTIEDIRDEYEDQIDEIEDVVDDFETTIENAADLAEQARNACSCGIENSEWRTNDALPALDDIVDRISDWQKDSWRANDDGSYDANPELAVELLEEIREELSTLIESGEYLSSVESPF